MVTGGLVNFRGDSSNAFSEVAFLDPLPGGGGVGSDFVLANELELGEQRIDPKILPMFTIQWLYLSAMPFRQAAAINPDGR
jgi:hypothetical protein